MSIREEHNNHSILSDEELAFCQATTVSRGSGEIVELDFDTNETDDNYSKSPLSERELNYLISTNREDGANLQEMQKRVRCREQRNSKKPDSKIGTLIKYGNIVFERFLSESRLADNTNSLIIREHFIKRKNLALAIYSRTIAEINLLQFKELVSVDVADKQKLDLEGFLALTDELKETTEIVDAWKSVLGIKLGIISESEFITTNEEQDTE